MKCCPKCGITKMLSEFGKDLSKKDGAAYACKPCTSAYRIAYGREQRSALGIPKREKRVTYEQKLERQRAYRQECSKSRDASREYKRRNPERIRAINEVRRAASLRARPQWADIEKIASFYAEARRLTRETGVAHHVDHIVPLRSKVVCGLHVQDNLRVIPAIVNFKKGNRLVEL